MMNPNPRPLSMRKKVQLMVALTILAWATQTLFHQWGFGKDLAAQTRAGGARAVAAPRKNSSPAPRASPPAPRSRCAPRPPCSAPK